MLPISRCNTIGFRLVLTLSIIVITMMALTPQPEDFLQANINDKVGHAIAFIYLSFMAHASFPKKTFGFNLALPLLCYGILIEIGQSFVPERFYSVADMFADAAGILIYFLLLPWVTKMTHKIFTLPENER